MPYAVQLRPLLHTLLVVAPLLVGCGSAASTATETPPGTDPHDAQTSDETSTTPPALPSATACHLHTDCSVAISAPDTTTLCARRAA